jgi:hypothetical protein
MPRHHNSVRPFTEFSHPFGGSSDGRETGAISRPGSADGKRQRRSFGRDQSVCAAGRSGLAGGMAKHQAEAWLMHRLSPQPPGFGQGVSGPAQRGGWAGVRAPDPGLLPRSEGDGALGAGCGSRCGERDSPPMGMAAATVAAPCEVRWQTPVSWRPT